MASASAIANTLVFSGFAAAATISQTLTHTEKDSATLESVIRDAESEAVLSTYGVDTTGRPLNNQITITELFASWDEEAGRSSSPEPSSDETFAGTDAEQDGNAGRSEEVSRAWSLSGLAADARKGIAISDFSHSLPDVDLTVTDLSIIRPCDSFAILGYYDLQKDPIIAETYTIPANDTRTNFPMTINWGNAFSNAVARGAFPLDARLSSAFLMAVWDIDSDSDGLTDLDELLVYHTDPNNPDSDGDGLNDGWEVANDMKPLRPDSDGDGLDDLLELEIGTNPSRSDSDNDGLPDGAEIDKGSDPNDPDTDGDGESDGSENDLGRDPTEDEDVGLVDPPPGTSAGTITGTAGVSFSWTADVGEDVEVPSLEVSTGNGEVSWGSGETYPFHMTVGGLSFVPSVTGLYEISLSADDDCEAFVGSVRVEDHYYGPHCEPKRGFFKAGQSYGVSVTLDNQGGPANFGLTASLVKVYREKFVNDFGPNVVIYEDVYENKPGQTVPKNSTSAGCDLVVTAGPEGGRLTIEGNYTAALELCAGTDLGLGESELAPFETKRCHGIFQGKNPSSSLDDVIRIVKWKPNGSQNETVMTNRLTVVKVGLNASADTPVNKHRHVFGVCEKVFLQIDPSGITPVIDFGNLAVVDRRKAEMPDCEQRGRITVSHGSASLALPWQSIKPSKRKAVSCFGMSSHWEWLNAGLRPIPNGGYGAAGSFETVLLPEYVSFEGLFFCEGECDATDQQGVYRDESMRNLLIHDSTAGAWKRTRIGSNNYSGEDIVSFWLKLPTDNLPTMTSRFSLAIPEYWFKTEDCSVYDMEMFHRELQIHTLNPTGSVKIEKFGVILEKDSSGFYSSTLDL